MSTGHHKTSKNHLKTKVNEFLINKRNTEALCNVINSFKVRNSVRMFKLVL